MFNRWKGAQKNLSNGISNLQFVLNFGVQTDN